MCVCVCAGVQGRMTDVKQHKEWQEQGIESLKLFNAFQHEHKNLVFYMSRSCDTKLYGYFANRNNNALIREHEVDCGSIMLPDWKTKSEVPAMILDRFFALVVSPIPNSKKYAAVLAGFPDRKMTLNLKQDSKLGKNDGIVTSTSTMHVAGETLHDVRVFCMHKVMTFNAMEIPDVKKIIVFGSVSKEHVSAKLREHLYPLSETQLLVWEEFPVTAELLKRFDVVALTTAYLFPSK